ncbi:MAG: Holliday junction resolvasome RuvABC DNA-binding subunit, partial [Bradymonadia bacterium]
PEAGDEPVTEEDLEREALQTVRGVGLKMSAEIHSAGYTKPIHLVFESDPERMSFITGLDRKKCKQILAQADKWYAQQTWSDEERAEHDDDREDFNEEIAERFQEATEALAEAEEV